MERLTKVKFSNLEKVLYPELGLTKQQIIEYYIRMAPRMLPFLENRALVRTRYPDGIYTEAFYEKDIPKGTPNWVKIHKKYSKSSEKDTRYVVCNDLDTFLWLANLAALELHIPLSRIHDTEKPDLMLFDLDPEPPAGLTEAKEACFLLKERLDDLGFKSFLKTSGKKGLHVVVPVEPLYRFEQTKEFVHIIGAKLANESDLIVSERSQTSDPGTVLIDYPQNSERSTMIAPYSLRPTREATVSAPLEWRELGGLRPFEHNIFSMLQKKSDPWKNLCDEPLRLLC